MVLIGTGGKGTGAGTMFPLAQMARQQKKLVIPIFVQPLVRAPRSRTSAASIMPATFPRTPSTPPGIRLIEILLMTAGTLTAIQQPQSVIWERMNMPIARGLRGLLYVLSDLSQVDQIATCCRRCSAGYGRLRLGSAEIDPTPGLEPSEAAVDRAVHDCWHNLDPTASTARWGRHSSAFRATGRTSSMRESRGGWRRWPRPACPDNAVRAALRARAPTRRSRGASPRSSPSTRGPIAPLEIDWTQERRLGSPWSAFDARPPVENAVDAEAEPEDAVPANAPAATLAPPTPVPVPPIEPAPAAPAPGPAAPPFGSLWEFALAVNRGNPAALAVASDQVACDVPISGGEVRKLLGTVWFRGVVAVLSPRWRDRILDALLSSVAIPDHHLKLDRRDVRLSELSYAQIKDVFSRNYVADAVRPDLDLLLTVARVWGAEALDRLEFAGAPADSERSRLASVLMALRK